MDYFKRREKLTSARMNALVDELNAKSVGLDITDLLLNGKMRTTIKLLSTKVLFTVNSEQTRMPFALCADSKGYYLMVFGASEDEDKRGVYSLYPIREELVSGEINVVVYSGVINLPVASNDDLKTLAETVAEMQLFKYPNVTIVGEPTINHGQISGFSNANYLILPFALNLAGKAFELNLAFTTGSDVNAAQNVIGGKFCLAASIQNGKLNTRISTSGTTWEISKESSFAVESNKTYYIKLSYDRLQYKLQYSTDGQTYSQDWVEVNPNNPAEGLVYIGVGNNFNNPFKGIINLNKCELLINGQHYWEGMDDAGLATRLATDLSNIDEEGKAAINNIVKEGVVGDSISGINKTIGRYSARPSLSLVADKDNMAIDAATGKPVAKTGWAISKPITIVRGNEYLIKVGQTDGNVWCAAKRTVIPAWDEEVKDPETGEVIDVIHHPEEVYYSKKVQLNAGAELPEDGYLRVLGMPQDFDMVVSYHKATADTTIIVLRDGLTANICTQVGEVDTAAEENLDANMQNVAESVGNVGTTVDTLEYRIGQYPQTLLGRGVPSASVRPINLGNDKHTGFPLPWLGTPEFVGQMYIDIDASNGGLYYAIPVYDTYGNITSLKWGNANS